MQTEQLIFVEAPKAERKDPNSWVPKLFLKKGRQLQAITPEQCGPLRDIYNDGRGMSQIRKDIYLYSQEGKKIGYISYNGRVWLNDIEGEIEVPVQGRKTAAQRELEGWK